MIEHILDIHNIHSTETDKKNQSSLSSTFPNNVHICHFYKSPKELLELMLPYFIEGLRHHEFCLWGVADPLNVETATKALDQAMDGGLAPYIKGKQIEIFDISALYGNGTFDAMAVKDAFLRKVNESLSQGWRGFRCDGMASGMAPSNWRNYQTYELEVTRTLMSRTTALCSYDLNKLTAENVVEVVSTHQASILKKHNSWVAMESAEHMALKESHRKEKEFKQMADMMPQLAWMANAYGTIYWYNKRWYDYTGMTPQKMMSKESQSVYDAGELPKLLENWRKSIESGKDFEMVLSLRGADGVLLPFLTRAMPLCDQRGRVTRWFGTCTDLSELTPLMRNASRLA